jgi:SAM-dependent methyltransferase
VRRLEPRPGVRWLDVATGTGGVALRAAAAGADAVGVDIAPAMIDVARSKADGLPARFDVGDAQALPYEDGEFEVVSSAFGSIFAPDHDATARELARVCSDRLGLTTWINSEMLRAVFERFDLGMPEGREPFRWGDEAYVERRLGEWFELEIDRGTWVLTGRNGEELWELWSSAAPPFKAMVTGLDDDTRQSFRDAYVEYCERFRDGDAVHVPRDYLLVLGRRR